MVSRNRRITSAKRITERAKAPHAAGPEECLVFGCNRSTQRSSKHGLSENYCHGHISFLRRHGHLTIRSYRRSEIEPYRKAAKKWLKKNSQTPKVLNAISRLNWIIDQSGRPTNAASVSGHPPVEKARIALARLRVAGKNGKDLLIIALTVTAAQTAIGPAGGEYRYVQMAKMAHRLASGAGEIKQEGYLWPLPPKWPRAEGIMMRILGRQIEERSELVVTEEVVEEVIRLALGTAKNE